MRPAKSQNKQSRFSNDLVGRISINIIWHGYRKHKKPPLHLVSAWVKENKCLLAQVKTAEKSNEIEAIPRLLKMLDIKEAVVTVDAMGCQKEIAQQIVQQEVVSGMCGCSQHPPSTLRVSLNFRHNASKNLFLFSL